MNRTIPGLGDASLLDPTGTVLITKKGRNSGDPLRRPCDWHGDTYKDGHDHQVGRMSKAMARPRLVRRTSLSSSRVTVAAACSQLSRIGVSFFSGHATSAPLVSMSPPSHLSSKGHIRPWSFVYPMGVESPFSLKTTRGAHEPPTSPPTTTTGSQPSVQIMLISPTWHGDELCHRRRLLDRAIYGPFLRNCITLRDAMHRIDKNISWPLVFRSHAIRAGVILASSPLSPVLSSHENIATLPLPSFFFFPSIPSCDSKPFES